MTGAVFESGQKPMAIYSDGYGRNIIAKADADGLLSSPFAQGNFPNSSV